MSEYKTVLIVEDDEGIREALKLTLEFDGYHVETAENGKEGLERLSTIKTPCLILLDLMMPVMDGWAFAEAMRKDMMLAAIPIVVVTAFADKAEAVGAARIIKKPVDTPLLLRFVREYCGQ
jgi:CheY-like chemotaxis protein